MKYFCGDNCWVTKGKEKHAECIWYIFLVFLVGNGSLPLAPSDRRLPLPTRRVGTTVKKINVQI